MLFDQLCLNSMKDKECTYHKVAYAALMSLSYLTAVQRKRCRDTTHSVCFSTS